MEYDKESYAKGVAVGKRLTQMSMGRKSAVSGSSGTGRTPVIQALTVTENGSYTAPSGIDGYSPVTVNVPQNQTVQPNLETLNVTENGTYTPSSGKDGYSQVTVNVPTPEPVLEALNVTENGTYSPNTGTDGYSQVTVDVPPRGLLIPIAYDLSTGYVMSGAWNMGGSTVSYSDVYRVTAGREYLIQLGSAVGTRFRTILTDQDTSTATSKITGTMITNETNPTARTRLFYTPPTSGYLTITKDNAGLAGLKTYVVDMAELAP